ncbi:hypothetical protein ACHAXT_001385 [Thalassiosira profunda]
MESVLVNDHDASMDSSDMSQEDAAATGSGVHPTAIHPPASPRVEEGTQPGGRPHKPPVASPSRKDRLAAAKRRSAAARSSPTRNRARNEYNIDNEALDFFRSVVAQRSTDPRWAAAPKSPQTEDEEGNATNSMEMAATQQRIEDSHHEQGSPAKGSLSRDVQRVNRFHDVLFNPKPKPAGNVPSGETGKHAKNAMGKESVSKGQPRSAPSAEAERIELSKSPAKDVSMQGDMHESDPMPKEGRNGAEEFSPDDAMWQPLVASDVAKLKRGAMSDDGRGLSEKDGSRPVHEEIGGAGELSKPGKLVIPSMWSANQHALPTLDETQETEGSIATGITNNYALAMIRDNKERMRRFEEAYNAIMQATDAHQRPDNDAEIMARWLQEGGKRWARDPSMPSAVSIDGREYADYQRTPTIPVKQRIEAALRNDDGDTPRLNDQAAYEHWLAYERKLGQPGDGGSEQPRPMPNQSLPKGFGVSHRPSKLDAQAMEKESSNPEQTPSTPAKLQMDSMRQEEVDETRLHGRAAHEFWRQRMSQPDGGGNLRTELTSIAAPNATTSQEGASLAKKKLSDAESTGATTKTTELVSEHDESNLNLLGNLHIEESSPETLKNELMKWREKFRGPESPSRAKGVSAGDEMEGGEISVPEESVGNRLQGDDQQQSEQQNKSVPSGIDTRQLAAAALAKDSLLAHMFEGSIIDTDGTEISFNSLSDEAYVLRMQSLLLSPSIITKRYQQALTVIEGRRWNQLSYLLSANPWLMEMKDVRNDQTLVHALSLFGGGPNDADPLPAQLAEIVIDYDPSVAHKLDVEGNLPLHFAAAAGNVTMIRELGRRFPSAASVQNHNDLLPLHLAIMACDLFPSGVQAVEQILALFPGATRVRDNDKNTPLHVASSLRGAVGAHVVNLLVEHCDGDAYSEKNKLGDSPLATAIKSTAGSQVVEALLTTSEGQSVVLETNAASQNALHLALGSECDTAVVFSLLKAAPSTATIRDGRGLLPIEIAYMNSLQDEVFFAITIIDLPIDLGAKDGAILRRGFGTSWLYLLCETNDACVRVVNSVLDSCSFPQRIALCFATIGDKRDRTIAISRATPLSKQALRRAVGSIERFELVGDEKKSRLFLQQIQQFRDALRAQEDDQAGKKANIICYTSAYDYSRNVKHLQPNALDPNLFEELSYFTIKGIEALRSSGVLHCVAVEKPTLSLANVVSGMKRQHRSDLTILGRYYGKCRSILRQTAKALRHLHANNIVHGLLDANHIGKFDDKWKVSGLIGSIVWGGEFTKSRLGTHSPPEAFVLIRHKHSRESNVSLDSSLEAEPAVDVWAFGKLMYEVLVGEPLFTAFSEETQSDIPRCIFAWDASNVLRASQMLVDRRVGPAGIDLISRCLQQNSTSRMSMEDILQHPFWKDKDAFNFS